jgi:hypothetical protein
MQEEGTNTRFSHISLPQFSVTSSQQLFRGDNSSLLSSPGEQVPANSCSESAVLLFPFMSFYLSICATLITGMEIPLFTIHHTWLYLFPTTFSARLRRLFFLTSLSLVRTGGYWIALFTTFYHLLSFLFLPEYVTWFITYLFMKALFEEATW